MKEMAFRFENIDAEESRFEEAAYLLRALGNETRLRVIVQLAQNEKMSVTELQQKTGCEQSLLSHHLTDMRAKGILSCRRSGKRSIYSINDKRIINVLRCVMSCGQENPLHPGSESLN